MKLDVPVIGILRGIGAEKLRPLMHAAFGAGLQAMEVTINTVGAEKMIAANRDHVSAGNYLGMGTIRNPSEARKALAAGANFFVTPNLDPEVIEFARHKDIPVIAGALTPTEVYKAWKAGAAMVKVFPCRALGGPLYIKELRGPFDHIRFVAVGGVTIENGREYLQAGAAAMVARNVKEFIKRCTVS
jgi:2-dehydro-3-deoxyphosphogluconate aldolase/(4S)-4-hydroxy-2-oxoglutarate aldolase